MDWQMVPAWVVVLLFSALVILAYHCGMMAAELRSSRPDASRWAWAVRQAWFRDGVRLEAAELDAMADAGIEADRLRWSAAPPKVTRDGDTQVHA